MYFKNFKSAYVKNALVFSKTYYSGATGPLQMALQISNSSSTAIILQTAKATALNPDENYSTETRLQYDSCIQRIYYTDDLKRKLNLKKVRDEKILLKRVPLDEGVFKELDVVKICVKGKLKVINTYIEALCSYLYLIAQLYQTKILIFQKTQQNTTFYDYNFPIGATAIINPLIFL